MGKIYSTLHELHLDGILIQQVKCLHSFICLIYGHAVLCTVIMCCDQVHMIVL